MSGHTYSWEVFFPLLLLKGDNSRWTTLTRINVDRQIGFTAKLPECAEGSARSYKHGNSADIWSYVL